MIRHIPILSIALAAALLCGACKDSPNTPAKPAAAEPPPDSLSNVGEDTAALIKLWTTILELVETEDSAKIANTRLVKAGEQFDALLERAKKLPVPSATERKRIDAQVDAKISKAASGLERQRKRIFILPDEIKRHVLPAHDQLVEKFREMTRAISNLGDSPEQQP